MRVLVVEDDQDIRNILDRHFREQNRHAGAERVEVIYCSTLEGALQENLARNPDVVLLDLGLDDSSSDNTAESILKFEGAPAPAVVVLTGNVRTDLVQKCFAAGADSYVHKNALMGRFEYLFSTLLNASLRRRNTPGYARKR